MKGSWNLVLATGALMLLVAPAMADWAPGDGHKMHFPQLPDPEGWDIDITLPNIVADDWKCSQTGPVTDVHIWFSVEGEDGSLAATTEAFDAFEGLHLSIHKDIPDPDGDGPEFSMPGELLWERDVTDVTIPEVPGQGLQGWANPPEEVWRPGDHVLFMQANMIDIEDPFIQREGEIYWLDVGVKMREGYDGPKIGWKTSLEQWNDDAVYIGLDGNWNELWEFGEVGGRSLDMAFVITGIPEPSSLVLVLIAGLIGVALCRRQTY